MEEIRLGVLLTLRAERRIAEEFGLGEEAVDVHWERGPVASVEMVKIAAMVGGQEGEAQAVVGETSGTA